MGIASSSVGVPATRRASLLARVSSFSNKDQSLVASWRLDGQPSLSRKVPHWDDSRAHRGDLANYVWFATGVLLDPSTDALLDPRDFPPGPVGQAYWAPPASGTSIPAAAAAQLEVLWADHTSASRMVGAADPELSALEGRVKYRLVRHRSRERALRDAKIRMALTSGFAEMPSAGLWILF